MPFLPRIHTLLCLLPCLLLCQACAHLRTDDSQHTAQSKVFEFRFNDDGKANYFVLDKHNAARHDAVPHPDTYLFVLAGSDCMSMGRVLPAYFDGLEGKDGAIRIFILQKRFIEMQGADRCSVDFTLTDHPSRWIADQSEFIRTELDAAHANGQMPRHIVIAGISEGAEIAPILAHRFPAVTHVALIGNGGMDPYDAYRLQAEKHNLRHGPAEIARRCSGTPRADEDLMLAADRTCRYWYELQAIRHADNLLGLDIPVFIAMGEADTMVPIESAWLIRDKFAAHGKTNLQLLTIPDTGHDFRRNGLTMLPYVWGALEQWVKK